jgi:hypothetical protein
MYRLILVAFILSFDLSASSPPAESFERVNAVFPEFVFINPQGE